MDFARISAVNNNSGYFKSNLPQCFDYSMLIIAFLTPNA